MEAIAFARYVFDLYAADKTPTERQMELCYEDWLKEKQ